MKIIVLTVGFFFIMPCSGIRSYAKISIKNMLNRLCYTTLLFLSIFQKVEGNSLPPFEPNSLFARGKWIKIETSSTGIHKISFSWLKSTGFLHPENVKLFGKQERTDVALECQSF